MLRLLQRQAVLARTSPCCCKLIHTSLGKYPLSDYCSTRWGMVPSGRVIRGDPTSHVYPPSLRSRISTNGNSIVTGRNGSAIAISSSIRKLLSASLQGHFLGAKSTSRCFCVQLGRPGHEARLTEAPSQLVFNMKCGGDPCTSDLRYMGGPLSLTAYDAYGRHIQYMIEQAIGPPRTSEFRSLRLVNRSMTCMHILFVPLLILAPPTSLELLLVPHSQLCCLCTAQTASVSLWGFGIARMGPLASGGISVSDWRLAIGLAFFWICALTLIISLKNPKVAYAIQIPLVLALHLIERILASPSVGALPTWWVTGSNRRMRLVVLISAIAALLRAIYVEENAEEIMARALEA